MKWESPKKNRVGIIIFAKRNWQQKRKTTSKRDAKTLLKYASKYSTPSMGSLQTSTCDYYWRGQSSLACPWKARAAVHGIAWWWSGDVGLRVPGRVTWPPQPPPHNLKQKQRAWSLPRACLASLHPGPGHSALVDKPPICLLKKETPHTTYLSHRKGSIIL